MFDWRILVASLAGSGVVSTGVVLGLSRYLGDRWMVRYRARFDRELEAYKDTLEQRRKRIEAEVGHRTYIGKTQFDTEYGALRDCFAAIGRLRLAMNSLRPMVDLVPEHPDERLGLLGARLKSLMERYALAVDAVVSVYPFIQEEIYNELEKCLRTALIEMRHVEADPAKAFSPSGCDQGFKAQGKFDTSYYAASKLTRQRFKYLSIVPE
jgi:hypothetical protein